jgi:hypothetical protein
MADKEYTVIEILDILRRYAAGDRIKAIARSTGMDRKTISKYIRIAEGVHRRLRACGSVVFPVPRYKNEVKLIYYVTS